MYSTANERSHVPKKNQNTEIQLKLTNSYLNLFTNLMINIIDKLRSEYIFFRVLQKQDLFCFCFQEMTIPWCLRRAELVFKCVKGEHNRIFNNDLYFFLPNTQSRATQEKDCEWVPQLNRRVPQLNGLSSKYFIADFFYLSFPRHKYSVLFKYKIPVF